MKTHTIEQYECETCGTKYDTEAAARKCQSRKRNGSQPERR